MFTYPVCNIADEDIYYKQCAAIEKYVHPLEKLDEMDDVDGSKIQPYKCNGESIKVINSIYTNEVYVESEKDIRPFFS